MTVARVLRPHGRRGEVAAEILTDFPQRLKALTSAWLCGGSSPDSQAAIRSCWLSQSRGGQAIFHFRRLGLHFRRGKTRRPRSPHSARRAHRASRKQLLRHGLDWLRSSRKKWRHDRYRARRATNRREHSRDASPTRRCTRRRIANSSRAGNLRARRHLRPPHRSRPPRRSSRIKPPASFRVRSVL